MQHNLIALGLAAGLGLFALSASPTVAGPCGSHPYFDDQGTLTWYTTLDEAVAAARASGRTIFVEFGRKECRNCRIVVQKILPCAAIRARISATCVGLAADCDEPDPRVEALFKVGLPDANTLPFCGFATSDLKWITGHAGLMGADECMRQLDLVESSRAPDARPRAPPAADRRRRRCPPTTALPVAPSGGVRAPSPAPAELTKCRAMLDRAREAAARAHYGDVVRLDGEAERMPLRVEPAVWKSLVSQAATWSTRTLDGAVVAGRERRYDDATKLLNAVQQEMTGLAAGREAQTGAKALARARVIDGISGADQAKARATALEEFRGTRWLELFRG